MMEALANKKATNSSVDARHPVFCSESLPPKRGTSAVTVLGKPKKLPQSCRPSKNMSCLMLSAHFFQIP